MLHACKRLLIIGCVLGCGMAAACMPAAAPVVPAAIPDRPVDTVDNLIGLLVEAPADCSLHVRLAACLAADPATDPVELANEQLIVDAFADRYPATLDSRHHALHSMLNHQAWHLIVNGRRTAYAEALVRQALSLAPDECDYLDTLAELRFRQNRADEAAVLIRKALEQTTDRGRPMGECKRRYLNEQLQRFTAGPDH